jgi:hypothetical protein
MVVIAMDLFTTKFEIDASHPPHFEVIMVDVPREYGK